MGIAGATTASGQGGFVVLAGVAGLLAGAFSMAAGEYVSMRSQTELLERQIELERADHWVKNGARPSQTVGSIITKARKKLAA